LSDGVPFQHHLYSCAHQIDLLDVSRQTRHLGPLFFSIISDGVGWFMVFPQLHLTKNVTCLTIFRRSHIRHQRLEHTLFARYHAWPDYPKYSTSTTKKSRRLGGDVFFFFLVMVTHIESRSHTKVVRMPLCLADGQAGEVYDGWVMGLAGSLG
jgi:hypothetical protein